jgi:hypothetical protein
VAPYNHRRCNNFKLKAVLTYDAMMYIPLVLVFNKVDVVKEHFALEWLNE